MEHSFEEAKTTIYKKKAIKENLEVIHECIEEPEPKPKKRVYHTHEISISLGKSKLIIDLDETTSFYINVEDIQSLNSFPNGIDIWYLDRSVTSTPGINPPQLSLHIPTDDYTDLGKLRPNEELNKKLALELLTDEKELAEHTMLVDLARNDLGRVSTLGTVKVKSLMQIKKFSHVQHIVSHVIGKLDIKYDAFDALKAVFPAGTVSGAPKIRAMEIINELEPERREPYAGALGYFSFNGCCDFAIAIRSIFIEDNKGFVQSGAGIVSDSIDENEFKETEHKAGAMLQALREAST